jgi:cell division initiation protein
MKLTPLDIRHREFKRAMRGYADVEVDEFLDEVADEFERVFKENIDLRERVEALEEQVARYHRMEETLQKTLISAQASADELKQNSSREAQLIVNEAELQARQLVNEAYTERQSIEQATARLRSSEQDFRFKFRQMLQGYLQLIDDQSEGHAAAGTDDAQTDFARRAEEVKQAIEREGAGMPAGSAEEASATVDAAESDDEPAVASIAGPEPAEAEPAEPEAAEPEAAEPEAAEPERPREPVLPSPDEVTAGNIAEYMPPTAPAEPGSGAAQPERERITFGETDDLLADVDSGVNENEFKW